MFLPSGDPMAWMFDFRTVLFNAKVLDGIAEAICAEIPASESVQIGGLETASLPLITAVVLKLNQQGRHATGFYMRKSRDKDGRQRSVEGELTDAPIVLVDDLLNEGKSFIRQITHLHSLGKKIILACAILRFKDASYYSLLEEKGIRLFTMFSLKDFPEVSLPENKHEPSLKEKMPFSAAWSFSSPDPNYFHVLPKSAPVHDESRVYFGADNGTMWAIHKSNGTVAWKYKIAFGTDGKMIYSSPALSYKHNALYFGAYDGNLYALDTRSGAPKWISREADWIGSSPAIADSIDLVFVGVEFGLWTKRGGLLALHAGSGKKVWLARTEGLVHSSPAYSAKYSLVVYGDNEGSVYGIDARSGSVRWVFKAGGAVKASFAIDEEKEVVAFGSFDGSAYMLSIADGSLVRSFKTKESIYSTPLFNGGDLIVASLDKYLYCFDTASGTARWTFKTQGRIFSSPIIIAGHICIGSNDGRLYELDGKTGKERAFFQASERIVNAPSYDEKSGYFYLTTFGNELLALTRDQPSASA